MYEITDVLPRHRIVIKQGAPMWTTRVSWLLEEPLSYRAVRDDAPLDQALTVAGAAGAEPLLVDAEHVVIRGQRGPLADVGQHIAEADELPRQLREDVAEGVFGAAQRPVR